MKTIFRAASIIALPAVFGLAACSGKSDAPKPPLNETAVANVTEENATTDAPPPAAVTPPISDAQSKSEPVADPNELPQSDGPGPSPQVRDDADASGMTARLPDSDDVQPAEK
jgi:hypothetical protein